MSQNVPKIKKERMAIRQNLVKRLVAKGLSREDILSALKKEGHEIDRRTLTRDINDIKKEIWEQITKNKEPIEAVLTEFLIYYDETYREAWKLFLDATDEKVRVRCLETINKMLESKVSILQSLGILKTAPIQVEGTVTVKKALELIRTVKMEVKKEKKETEEVAET